MDVDFYTLERPVQDRFADATRSIGLPSPILHEAPADRRVALWLGAAIAFAGAVAWLVPRGFGSLASPVAIAPPAFAGIYALGVGAVTFCVLRALSISNARTTIPYRAGLYLFPAGVFDARSEPMRVFLHPELRGASIDGTGLRVTSAHGDFVFRLPDVSTAEQMKGAFDRGRAQYEQAVVSDNRREQAMLDPLVNSGFSSPFSPQQRLIRRRPVWAKVAPLLALVAGIAVGPAVWKARNLSSERRLYATAIAIDQIAAYRAYVARGGPRPEVPEVLLPRAELRQAASAGTVEALEGFVATHPGTKIRAEADAALRAALAQELAAAVQTGTVTALRDFGEKRAAYAFLQPAITAATAAVYRGALDKFAAGRDPRAAAFLERVLAYTRSHGPRVAVRFLRRLKDSVAAADAQVKMSAYFMGKQSTPSQYFVGEYASRREGAASLRIAHAFAAVFPPDILRVEMDPTVTDGAAPPLNGPTIVVEYMPDMAGGYMSPKPRGVFVGVGLTFRASFQIPGDDQLLEVRGSLWRTPNPQILRGEGTTVADVYERMAADGFAKFLKDFFELVGLTE
jgi:hypothetical protein